jgi:hypothetical protein
MGSLLLPLMLMGKSTGGNTIYMFLLPVFRKYVPAASLMILMPLLCSCCLSYAPASLLYVSRCLTSVLRAWDWGGTVSSMSSVNLHAQVLK